MRSPALPTQQDPGMMQMMQGMQDPQYRETIEQRLQELKSDPELASVMQDIETGGPAAMMKCESAPGFVSALPLFSHPGTAAYRRRYFSGSQKHACAPACATSRAPVVSLQGLNVCRNTRSNAQKCLDGTILRVSTALHEVDILHQLAE